MENKKQSKLNSDASSPLYVQLMQKIKNGISTGELKTGSRIQPEQELCSVYGVSRITVRKAITELEKEGILEKKQGKGTFVTVPAIHRKLHAVNSFHDTCRMNGKKPSTRVLVLKTIVSGKQDVDELGVAPGSRVIETVRVHFADRVPVILEENHFSMAYSYLLESDLNGSLYNLLSECGAEPAQATHVISLKNASKQVAGLLKIEENTPVLYLHEVIYDQKGRPLHTSSQYIRGDIFAFRV
ncbi:MAG: GntR family transcriptional regulator [Lachnospiraceae bacterium]|nr:GntR family transcriptional regulator [Lachnospiraceae bacterium]